MAEPTRMDRLRKLSSSIEQAKRDAAVCELPEAARHELAVNLNAAAARVELVRTLAAIDEKHSRAKSNTASAAG